MEKKNLSDPLTLRLPTDILADVEAIAAVSQRTRSWVMVRALRTYLAGEGAEILRAAEGLRQLQDGSSHDMDTVLNEIEEIVRGKVA